MATLNLVHFILQSRPVDGGPIYTETDLSQFVAEPWNAITAFFFMGIVGFWIYKLWGKFREHKFLTAVLPLLAIGGIGGTLYHAFRMSSIFLLMDWLPIALITLGGSIYFMIRLLGKWYYGILIIVAAFGLEILNFNLVPIHYAINVSYSIMGLLVLSPIVIQLIKTKFFGVQWVGIALTCFALAILFRTADQWAWLPMGTHFLWHSFGALTCHFMFWYIYKLGEEQHLQAKITGPSSSGLSPERSV